MDRQSEWIVLRRVLAFLKSRKLTAAAYALEKEARLSFNIPRLHAMFVRGRWRRADEYVTAFVRGKGLTAEASGTLFPIRMQRFLRALRRGDGSFAWAHRYRRRSVEPLLLFHPDRVAAVAELHGALMAADEGRLGQAYPDDEDNRSRCFVRFLRYSDENKYLDRCAVDPVGINLKFMNRTSCLGIRRFRRRRRPATHTTPTDA